MSVSRRGFLQGLSVGRASHAAEFMAARGHEEHVAELQQRQGGRGMNRPQLPPGVEAIRISSNENPLGPGKAVLDTILGRFPEANRYPFNSTPSDSALTSAIASKFRIKPENIVLGGGSQELLKNAVRAFTSPARGLVTTGPYRWFRNPMYTVGYAHAYGFALAFLSWPGLLAALCDQVAILVFHLAVERPHVKAVYLAER